MAPHPTLDAARVFVHVAQDLMSQPDLATTRAQIVSLAVTLTGCTSAALLTVTPSTEVRVVAGTEPQLCASLARIATQTAQGPAVAARGCAHGIAAVSMPQERRWPEYAQQVLAATAIRSEAAYPLQVEGQDFGVLSLHSVEDGYFTDDIHATAEIYAGHSLLALLHARERDKTANLEIGLASNREIGMAIGVLMTSYRVTDQEAFDLLRTASQHGHRKLRELAADVVLTGQLPADASRTPSESPVPQRSLAVA
jgi:GAF domain-containing protein